MKPAPATYDTWTEIDLSAIYENVRALKVRLGPETRLMAVVKADGYGHGAKETATAALDAGASALGVARMDEALQLRTAGIDAPILIFGHTRPALTVKLLSHGLTQTVWDVATARDLSDAAVTAGLRLCVHIKVDSGMGRLGIACGKDTDYNRAVDTVAAVHRLPGLEVEGIYTHFATADEADKACAMVQFKRFTTLLERLSASGIHIPIRHAANTAAIIDLPETHLDMVRAGIGIYGVYPSADVDHATVRLVPAMSLKSRVIQVKKVAPGFAVSYGHTARTTTSTLLATIAVGYGDGFPRPCSNRGKMLVRGRPAPVIGRVCMDQTILDVGHIPGVVPGDEVVVFGGSDDACIPVESLAKDAQTISYEILTGISGRVKRIYTDRIPKIS
ncbi:MAG: alanine racemase [Deltaproteobacteria bacterium]|nr:alanine racemase [Deltaproteobacteria bacterium]